MAKTVARFCVLDTNIIIYGLNADSPQYAAVRDFLDRLQKKGYRFCTTEQIVRETLVVATQSRCVAKPLDAAAARRLGTQLLFQSVFLPSNHLSRLALLELVETHALKGRVIHDANIVAVMRAHEVKELATYNRKDFLSFRDIAILQP